METVKIKAEDKQAFKQKVDDLLLAMRASNAPKFTEKETTFIQQMKTRIFVTEKQKSWLEALWERI